MTRWLYVYDCKSSRTRNARRVAFTKELFGYTYAWKTKAGIKQKRKPGIIEQCAGSIVVSDSAILIYDEHKAEFDNLFKKYQDILVIHVFQVIAESDLI